MSAHSTAVANKFIRLAKNVDKSFTQMQLQKLVYIANGWNLVINDDPLTEDSPCAWDYGPVYPELRDALKSYGRAPVNRPIKFGDFVIFSDNSDEEVSGDFSKDESDVIGKVFEVYGGFHAFKLSALTHQEDTPWYNIYMKQKNRGGEIPMEDIKAHFITIASNT